MRGAERSPARCHHWLGILGRLKRENHRNGSWRICRHRLCHGERVQRVTSASSQSQWPSRIRDDGRNKCNSAGSNTRGWGHWRSSSECFERSESWATCRREYQHRGRGQPHWCRRRCRCRLFVRYRWDLAGECNAGRSSRRVWWRWHLSSVIGDPNLSTALAQVWMCSETMNNQKQAVLRSDSGKLFLARVWLPLVSGGPACLRGQLERLVGSLVIYSVRRFPIDTC